MTHTAGILFHTHISQKMFLQPENAIKSSFSQQGLFYGPFGIRKG